MIRVLNLFASGLDGFNSSLFPDTTVSRKTGRLLFVPSNTPFQAVAGDFLRVGTQLRIAEQARRSLQQAEFNFAVHHA